MNSNRYFKSSVSYAAEKRRINMSSWNVTVIPLKTSGLATALLINAEDIKDAIQQGEKYGVVVKAVHKEMERNYIDVS